MSLLTDADKVEIRAAIKLVTDTFFVTPAGYRMAIESTDVWGEDRADMAYTTYDLMVLCEYPDAMSQERDVHGALDKEKVKLSVNLADIIDTYPALVDSVTKKLNFNETKDYVDVDGITYQVDKVYYDGPLDRQNVLLMIEAHQVPNPT